MPSPKFVTFQIQVSWIEPLVPRLCSLGTTARIACFPETYDTETRAYCQPGVSQRLLQSTISRQKKKGRMVLDKSEKSNEAELWLQLDMELLVPGAASPHSSRNSRNKSRTSHKKAQLSFQTTRSPLVPLLCLAHSKRNTGPQQSFVLAITGMS